MELLHKLDKAIVGGYASWVQLAPGDYKDGFFTDRIPIIVTSTYGQNQRLGLHPTVESKNWHRDRDFSKVRFMTVALATHLWYG